MTTKFRILIAALILLPTAAFATSDDWRVVKATDQVKYTVDRTTWLDLRAGEVVPNRAWVSTGPRGRVQLARGVESITFQPNSLAAITTNESAAMKTRIYQQVGSLDLEIEKRSQPHTTVQTPYLAAVVKGTIFHVTVGKAKATVSVDRGLVEVTSFASGQRSNVAPGQSAAVDNKVGMTVAGRLSKPEITSVAPSVAQIPAVGTAKLAGATDKADETKNTSSATSKSTSSSASGDDRSGNGKSNGNSSSSNNGSSSGNGNNGNGNGNSGGNSNGNSGGNGNGNGHSDDSGNNGNGNGNGHSNDSGNNGNGNGGGNGNGNSGRGDNNGGGNGNGNSGDHGKGKDK